MKQYELTVIYDPDAAEASGKANAKEAVEALLKKLKVSVVETDNWGRKSLSYEIDGHDIGYYVWQLVEMEPKTVSELESRLKRIDGVLRWLVVLADDEDTTNDVADNKKE